MKKLMAALFIVIGSLAFAELPLCLRDFSSCGPEIERHHRTAAEDGNIESAFVLGLIYDFDKEDYQLAVKWYRIAAEGGHGEAAFSLGEMYESGGYEGVPQDLAEAVRWYRAAAEQGYDLAQEWLAIAYFRGYVLPKDDEKAVRWARLAGMSEEELAERAEALAPLFPTSAEVAELDAQIEAVLEAGKAEARLQPVGKEYIVYADTFCKTHVENLSKYTYKWTDGFLGLKFSRFQWKDEAEGIVRYYGDQILFQNGFGAWVNMVYWCDYDTVNERPVRVGAEPGRLSD